MNVFFPIHLDVGNRGCEAIAKGTARLLGLPASRMHALCTDVPADRQLGMEEYYTLCPRPGRDGLAFRMGNRAFRTAVSLCSRDVYLRELFGWRHDFHRFLSGMKAGDVMLLTGGDMMCYGDNYVLYNQRQAQKKKVRTILWGCSMGEENLSPRKMEALRRFDLRYARESLTEAFFHSLGLTDTFCRPDPAFILEPEQTPLPPCFGQAEVVGINLSSYTLGGHDLDSPFGGEVRELIRHILETTSMHILLIPHVFWAGQDDRIAARAVREAFPRHADRISILESETLSYTRIRYVISRCQLFIGARTHAVISAYATGVPAIALSYSIKSRGIARDLGMGEETVVDTRAAAAKGRLTEAFAYVREHRQQLAQQLSATLPGYTARLDGMNKLLQTDA